MYSPPIFSSDGHHSPNACRLKYFPGLRCYMAQCHGTSQLPHTLPAPQRHGDAGAVHERDAGKVQHQDHGQRALDLPLQAGEQALCAVVIQLAPQLKL